MFMIEFKALEKGFVEKKFPEKLVDFVKYSFIFHSLFYREMTLSFCNVY